MAHSARSNLRRAPPLNAAASRARVLLELAKLTRVTFLRASHADEARQVQLRLAIKTKNIMDRLVKPSSPYEATSDGKLLRKTLSAHSSEPFEEEALRWDRSEEHIILHGRIVAIKIKNGMFFLIISGNKFIVC